MKVKCEYCGNYIEDTDEHCSFCGATNDHLMRSAEGVPKTVEELREFCMLHKLPLEQMRFFIGEDCCEARAFGIYEEDDGDFIVYKNKADGTRAVRYRGKDEAYAVNELYQKMRSEVMARKNAPRPAPQARTQIPTASPDFFRSRRRKRGCSTASLLAVGIFFAICIIVSIFDNSPETGYYSYDDGYYYNYNDSWYYYDDYASQWEHAESIDDELLQNFDDYYYDDADAYYPPYSFEDSEYYGSEYYDDYDDDYYDDWDDDWDSDWDSGWDSSSTDWDSDW